MCNVQVECVAAPEGFSSTSTCAESVLNSLIGPFATDFSITPFLPTSEDLIDAGLCSSDDIQQPRPSQYGMDAQARGYGILMLAKRERVIWCATLRSAKIPDSFIVLWFTDWFPFYPPYPLHNTWWAYLVRWLGSFQHVYAARSCMKIVNLDIHVVMLAGKNVLSWTLEFWWHSWWSY